MASESITPSGHIHPSSSTTTALPALRTSPSYIFFTDFDGTITLQDSNDFLTDNIGFGPSLRKQGNHDVLAGKRPFRDSFQEMMDSITTPFPECVDLLLRNVKLDPKFKEFWAWCRGENVPVVILSGGMEPVIRALLRKLLREDGGDDGGGGDDDDDDDDDGGLSEMQIVSNNVKARPGKTMADEKGWEIVFHDDSGFGHDKSLEIRKYSQLPAGQRPGLFYAGDGVSDLSAAKETDMMFAKAGKDLVAYCERENIPFTTFHDFGDIFSVVKDVVSGKITLTQAATGA